MNDEMMKLMNSVDVNLEQVQALQDYLFKPYTRENVEALDNMHIRVQTDNPANKYDDLYDDKDRTIWLSQLDPFMHQMDKIIGADTGDFIYSLETDKIYLIADETKPLWEDGIKLITNRFGNITSNANNYTHPESSENNKNGHLPYSMVQYVDNYIHKGYLFYCDPKGSKFNITKRKMNRGYDEEIMRSLSIEDSFSLKRKRKKIFSSFNKQNQMRCATMVRDMISYLCEMDYVTGQRYIYPVNMIPLLHIMNMRIINLLFRDYYGYMNKMDDRTMEYDTLMVSKGIVYFMKYSMHKDDFNHFIDVIDNLIDYYQEINLNLHSSFQGRELYPLCQYFYDYFTDNYVNLGPPKDVIPVFYRDRIVCCIKTILFLSSVMEHNEIFPTAKCFIKGDESEQILQTERYLVRAAQFLRDDIRIIQKHRSTYEVSATINNGDLIGNGNFMKMIENEFRPDTSAYTWK